MKITIWIRQGKDWRDPPTFAYDTKPESRDTMLITRYTKRLIAALTAGLEEDK